MELRGPDQKFLATVYKAVVGKLRDKNVQPARRSLSNGFAFDPIQVQTATFRLTRGEQRFCCASFAGGVSLGTPKGNPVLIRDYPAAVSRIERLNSAGFLRNRGDEPVETPIILIGYACKSEDLPVTTPNPA